MLKVLCTHLSLFMSTWIWIWWAHVKTARSSKTIVSDRQITKPQKLTSDEERKRSAHQAGSISVDCQNGGRGRDNNKHECFSYLICSSISEYTFCLWFTFRAQHFQMEFKQLFICCVNIHIGLKEGNPPREAKHSQ